MAVLVEDVARAALAAVDTDAGLLRAVRWTSERYRELTQRARFRHLRTIGEVHVPAPLTTGLCTVVRDSNRVTGNAAASVTWTTSLIGRHLRVQVTWYEIVDVIPSATAAVLILKAAYAEAPAATQPTGYRIVQRHVALAHDVRYLGEFLFMRRRRRLRPISLAELDMMFPGRNNITNGPRVVCEIGTTPDGVSGPSGEFTGPRKIIEMYPYSDLSETYRYAYWPVSRDLQIGDMLPDALDLTLLKRGVLVDVFRYEMAKAARMGQMDKAQLYRNEMRAQTTEWEGAILDAIKADKGLDDVTFILRTGGVMPSDDPLIKDAHDMVYARWPL